MTASASLIQGVTTKGPARDFPIQVLIADLSGGTDRNAYLSVFGARDLIAQLEEAVAEIDNASVVQVKVEGRNYSYATVAPLAVGDLVQVPWGYENNLKVGLVTGFGRNGWDGYLKDVKARFVAEELA